MEQRFYIIRGLPGSSKSTVAQMIAESLDGYHYEADMYFYDEDENYNFDPSQLHKAHKWCQHHVSASLEAGEHTIVSNTFTTQKELQPYLDMAKEYGIIPCVMTIHGSFGSIHDVPEEAVARMQQRFVYDIKL